MGLSTFMWLTEVYHDVLMQPLRNRIPAGGGTHATSYSTDRSSFLKTYIQNQRLEAGETIGEDNIPNDHLPSYTITNKKKAQREEK